MKVIRLLLFILLAAAGTATRAAEKHVALVISVSTMQAVSMGVVIPVACCNNSLLAQLEQGLGNSPGSRGLVRVENWTELESLLDSSTWRIAVSANQHRFIIGEPLVITIDVDRVGYLNVLNLGPGDTVPTVLYPNQLHPDNRVNRGQRIHIPDAEDGFELEAQGPAGKNLVVVVHTAEPINAYKDGAGSPADLFKTLSSTRGFAVKAKKERQGMGAGKLELLVEY